MCWELGEIGVVRPKGAFGGKLGFWKGWEIESLPIRCLFPVRNSGQEDGFADGWLSLSYAAEVAYRASLLLQI